MEGLFCVFLPPYLDRSGMEVVVVVGTHTPSRARTMPLRKRRREGAECINSPLFFLCLPVEAPAPLLNGGSRRRSPFEDDRRRSWRSFLAAGEVTLVVPSFALFQVARKGKRRRRRRRCA